MMGGQDHTVQAAITRILNEHREDVGALHAAPRPTAERGELLAFAQQKAQDVYEDAAILARFIRSERVLEKVVLLEALKRLG